jgi:hypothetical protein
VSLDQANAISLPSGEKLRGHVPDCPEDRACPSGLGGRGVAIDGALVEHAAKLGQAEVEDLRPAVPGYEEVLGLQVAVNDALLVGRGEAAGDLDPEVDDLPRRQRSPGEPYPQGFALEQLEDEVGRIALQTDVEHREDVGMADGSRCSSLVRKATHPCGLGSFLGSDDLDRDIAADPRVASAVHLSHPSRAEGRQDLVRAKACSATQRHVAGALDGILPVVGAETQRNPARAAAGRQRGRITAR